MLRKLWTLTFTVLFLTQLVSCGDLLESAKEEAPIGGVVSANCDLGKAADEIKLFLEKDVSQSVDCINANFKDFMRLVRSEKPGFLSRKELSHFIRSRNLVDKPEETLNYIDVLFKLSKLLFGTDGDFISEGKLNDLVEFAKTLNINMIKINSHFEDTNNRTFSYHNILKRDILRSAESISAHLDSIIVKNRPQLDKLDVVEVLNSFKFKKEETKQKIIDLLFVKRILMGGNPYIITHLELRKLINLTKISSLATVIFDVTKLNKLTFKDDKIRYSLYKDDIRELVCNFAYNDPASAETISSLQVEKYREDCLRSRSNNIYGNPLVFKNDELLNALKWFEDDLGLPLHNYPHVIEKAKEIFLTTDLDWYASDFNKVIEMTDEIFDMGKFFVDVYSYYSDHLDRPKRVSKDLSKFPICAILSEKPEFRSLFNGQTFDPDPKNNCGLTQTPGDLPTLSLFEEFKRQLDEMVLLKGRYLNKFVRITKNYRFFRSTDWSIPYFMNGFKRSVTGTFEIGMIETIMEKVFRFYENELPCDSVSIRKPCPDGEDNNATIHLGQMMEIIDFFKEPLYDLKIVLKGREDISAENTQLMSSLFQYQSDENGLMDVNEATEFAVGIFSVAPLGEKIHEEIFEKCINQGDKYEAIIEEKDDEGNVISSRKVLKLDLPSGDVDEFGRIAVSCFRKHFFPVFFSLSNNGDRDTAATVADSFPKLHKKIKSYGTDAAGQQKVEDFVLTIERFTRPCKGPKWEDISISKEDMIGIMGGIYNVESTIVRYDVNGNNVMDADEVDVAYDIYQDAVKGIIKEMEMADVAKKLAMGLHKQIFLYMIKNNEVPAVDMKFIKFLISFRWKAEATRETIASILKNIALQSKTSQNSTFNCNAVRYPQIPPMDPIIYEIEQLQK